MVTASVDELVKEIADSLIPACGLGKDSIVEMHRSRREKRGGFEQRIRLLWAE